MAGYLHVGKDADLGVSYWFSHDMLFNTYQFSIRPILGTNYWKKIKQTPPLPPIVRKMPGRPHKQIIRCPTEETNQVSRVGRRMTCTNCRKQGHNKKGCKNETQPNQKLLLGNLVGKLTL